MPGARRGAGCVSGSARKVLEYGLNLAAAEERIAEGPRCGRRSRVPDPTITGHAICSQLKHEAEPTEHAGKRGDGDAVQTKDTDAARRKKTGRPYLCTIFTMMLVMLVEVVLLAVSITITNVDGRLNQNARPRRNR